MEEWLIYGFNALLLTLNVYLISRYWKRQAPVVLALLLVNPITILSLFFVNKEIVGLTSVLLFMVFMQRDRVYYLILALLLSVLVRWQLGVTFIIMLPILLIIKNGKRPWLVPVLFIGLIAVMSVLYPLFLSEQIGGFEQEAVNRSNLARIALELQDNFLFALAFPIKVVLNLFGNPLEAPGFIARINEHRNVYDASIYVTQLTNFVLLVWIVLRGRWASNRVMSLLAVYLVLFTATPFIQTRYFYPIFPILYIMAATVRPLGVMGRRVRWKTRTLGA